MANTTDVESENAVNKGLDQGQQVVRAFVAPDGTITIPQSEANLKSIDVADVDLLLSFPDGTFVIIPNGALDAISDPSHPVVFIDNSGNGVFDPSRPDSDNKSTLGDLFKMVGISNHAKAGSLRVVSDNIEATKALGEVDAQKALDDEHVTSTSNDVRLPDTITAPAPMVKAGKGPGFLPAPSNQLDDQDPVVPLVTPRPPVYRAGTKSPAEPAQLVPTITLDANITADDIINSAEARGTVAITGTAGGDAKAGDMVTLTVNGVDSTGLVQADMTFSINVSGADLVADGDKVVDAGIITIDGAGNTFTGTDTESYSVDATVPVLTPIISLDANITADDIINSAEASGTVAITGSVGGDAKAGDTVTLTVNGVTSTGLVQTDNTFSINVAGSDLVADADKSIDASITTTDTAGNSGTATDSENYTVDITAPAPTITLAANITADDIINSVEASGTVAITGTVGGDAQAGDTVTLTVNGVDSTGMVQADMSFSINVSGSDLAADGDKIVDAGITATDVAGNTGTATGAEGYNIDVIRPTATILVDDTALAAGETAQVTITFNEAVAGFTNADLSVANGTLTAVSSADGGTTWTATLTPDAPVEDPANFITLADASVADLAGNINSGATDSNTYAIDTTVPVPTVTLDANITPDDIINIAEAGGNVVISGTVGGDARTGDTVTLTVNGTTYTGLVQTDNTFSINVAGSDLVADGDKTVDAGITTGPDAAGNLSTTGTATEGYSVDITAPTVATGQSYSFAENQALGAAVATVAASDNINITGLQIVGGSGQGFFAIDANGQINLTSSAANDFEGASNSFTLNIEAHDAAGNATTQTVTLNVTNVDEAAPVVPSGQIINYAENHSLNTVVGSVSAADDIGVTGYQIVGGSGAAYYNIDANGQITLTNAAANDYEGASNSFTLDIQASDAAGHTTTQTATLNVTNVNDAPTAILLSNNIVAENAEGAVIATLSAIDPDANDSHTYMVDDVRFEVVGDQLRLVAGQSLDFETEPTVNLVATATDRDGLTYSKSFVLTVTDVVDETPPQVNIGQKFDYAENQAAGTVIGTMAATDDTAVTGFRFTATGTNLSADGYYSIATDGQVSLTADGAAAGKAPNDFETGPNSFTYGIEAGDAAGNWSAAVDATFNVTDVFEPASAIVPGQSFNYSENQTIDISIPAVPHYPIIGTVAAIGSAGVTGFRFSVTGTNLSADGYFTINNSGQISLTATGITQASNDFETAPNNFIYDVQASNNVGDWSTAEAVKLNVTNVNEEPTGADATTTVSEDGTKVFAAHDFGFTDPKDAQADHLAAVQISSLPLAGTLQYNGTLITQAQIDAGFEVSVADLDAGKLTFTPAADANGAGYASFTFQVRDDGGLLNGGVDLDASANTFTIDVTPVNDAPTLAAVTTGTIAEVDQASSTTDANLSGTLAGADVDVETLTYGLTGGTDNGDGTFSTVGTFGTLTVDTTSGAYTFTKNAAAIEALDATETGSDVFTVSVTDADGALVTQS
ncbi:MAG: Ig-like domain-containing protein, partial [Desulfuromonadaceae bacterium]